MANGIPDYYLGGTPESTTALSPLQLALADYLLKGGEPVIWMNQDFLAEMQRYTNSNPVYPIEIETSSNYISGQEYYVDINAGNSAYLKKVKRPVIATGITGTAFIMLGEDIFIQRIAQDCGPDEDIRYEQVLIGQRTQIAQGTFAAYGKIVYSGVASQGTESYGPSYSMF